MMIFFWDPLEAQPHDPDIRALLRIAVVYDIPVATNRATADFMISVLLYGSGIQPRTSALPDNFGRRNRENFKIRTVKRLQIYRFDFRSPCRT